MNSAQNTTIRVDRYVLAEIRANRAMTDAVAEMAIALREFWITEKLLGTLLGRIVERIPAVRGVVVIPGSGLTSCESPRTCRSRSSPSEAQHPKRNESRIGRGCCVQSPTETG
jgi:hypothetical protein